MIVQGKTRQAVVGGPTDEVVAVVVGQRHKVEDTSGGVGIDRDTVCGIAYVNKTKCLHTLKN